MVSGDGLFHEFLNGAASRDDFLDFVKAVTVGIIPGLFCTYTSLHIFIYIYIISISVSICLYI